MSLDDQLADTFAAIRNLQARSPDELEDYFHDAVATALEKQRPLELWLPYIYRSVYYRLMYGREAKVYQSIETIAVPINYEPSISLSLDMTHALESISPVLSRYIYDYYYEGLDEPEIAIKYGVTKQAVCQGMQRGLKGMKQFLTDLNE